MQLLTPFGAIPDLQVVVDTGHRDLPPEPCVLDQRRREHQPPLLVELALRGAGEEVPLHHARALGERVESADPVCHRLPGQAGIGVEAAVEPPGHDDTVLEGRAELGRQREAVLVVEGMLMFT